MAALFRMNCMQSLRRGLTLMSPKETTIYRRIATTPNRYDGIKEETKPVKRKWVSYGFSDKSEIEDHHALHQTMFVCVTIVFVIGCTVMAYLPDIRGKDWAQREAYLQIRYREEHGLPLVSPNYIDPSKIILPTDEELGDTEIII
ncbi:NADH dehydrogenase [ubiquinone] 1 beta subcomplex subunit 11, mitochondrial [Trachymyrmex septentrionalis]|uniref:NADH dehydrogenase [ubiquinone] 1 beta subcomplex subunit 11, mitochondrial n=1 Tax=Trachymyrmex septentrionalis TaxID=34720 RepID=A0A195F5A2_9HYME|nr:PREDICTED: NADH dehydrogenase [ubiquinone] 1 beta subcomplex subunit 11, mitochondrial [Trachymyrmex septentrionalis]XP_018347945.1 PREDICTED: NADH dehydrogenase [ubiquinone] 1 beta subcomplex subunit 11, mitochondrial [Trachymyrmex septentrionalis]XP_018347946.1 PREDICTED: NADH dehydrogenase [ubiquinone] 1 beta subcomplex subunit 11, mitochondrial [Trachymyrmex septentrionalis]KYN35352.1 NADH dehydrogenase [ubiquinone] 1 beta subcomplex subunit 11, mitochondrial [Trachymyrmex septentrionalis